MPGFNTLLSGALRCATFFCPFAVIQARTIRSALCGAREQPASLIHRAEFEEVVGAENICDNVQSALRRAQQVHDQLESAAIELKS